MHVTPILIVGKTKWRDGDSGPLGSICFNCKISALVCECRSHGAVALKSDCDISKTIGNLGACFVLNPSPLIPNFLNYCVGHTDSFVLLNSKRSLKSRGELGSWFLIAEFEKHWSYLGFQLLSLYAMQSWSLLIYSIHIYQEFTICKHLLADWLCKDFDCGSHKTEKFL